MMKSFENLPPILGVPTAVFTITWTHLLFLPSFFITSALYQNPTVLVWLYAPGLLAVVLLVLTGLLGLWDVPVTNEKGIRKKQPLIEPYEWVVGKIERFYRPRVAGWKRGILRNIAIPALVASLLVGIPTAGWATILGVVAIIVNFFVLGGSVRREPTYVNDEGDSRPSVGIEESLTNALMDFFTKEADYRVKTDEGSFIDNQARYDHTASHIKSVEEVEPQVYKVHFRVKNDEKFMKALDDVKGDLDLYDFERKDEDERLGHVTVKFWATKRVDATTGASGATLWDTTTEPGKTIAVCPSPTELHIGVETDGSPTKVGLWETNIIVAGLPGSGKSVTITAIYTQLAQMKNVAVLNFDPKLVELTPWTDRASFTNKDDCCFSYALTATFNEMNRRYAIMNRNGWDKITPSMWDEFPQLVLVLDELDDIFADPDDPAVPSIKSYNYHITRKLVKKGRAAAISVILATQRPSGDLVPTPLRNLIQQGIAHRLTRESDTKMVLGDVKNAKAHELTASQKGVGYIVSEGSTDPTMFRTSLILKNKARLDILENPDAPPALLSIAENTPTVEEFVEATRHLRVSLPFIDNDESIQEHMEWHRRIEEEEYRRIEEEERQKQLGLPQTGSA